MSMDDALDLAHFKTLLEQRAAELDQLLEDAESRSQSVELDQSKVGRLSRIDALQQQAMMAGVTNAAS
ncbi:hypothetical protein BYI23_E002360 (plasmid) [Burkholderia sp. YI23]|uniref:TraR/DksA family transcriptional regulator n=3 Tax=Pseudomonas TaxID=286 RepID=Q0E6E3_PSEAI|nr:hypothetical protein BYI23_E002360 [Burkholderia sp. YI23]ERV57858.1 hypothetical protein Q065_00125 [Pseudomonas aeruginosa BL11]ERY45195.1 hypothetical protein Q060_05010 [Pseudomonas aeruginosa BL06]PRW30977.1 hypothetical protein CSB96_1744 [Pseudomonas aeruginosa]CBL87900.1 hypothetical protein [Pseudomonas sp. Tik3]SDG36020.1 DnaK suppressor protein [Pseudomonas benzenivorans]